MVFLIKTKGVKVMEAIDWTDSKVKDALNVIKLYLMGMDGEDGGIINITQKVLPDFSDDYEIIADDWNDLCPAPSEEFKDETFRVALLNGDENAVEKLKRSSEKFYEDVMEFAERARNKINAHHAVKVVGLKWVAESSDGCYTHTSGVFNNLKECYEDMRNAALEKAKWNTEFDEDFEEGVVIGYEFKFHPLKITHESYSGTYTYRVVNADGTEVDKSLFPYEDGDKA